MGNFHETTWKGLTPDYIKQKEKQNYMQLNCKFISEAFSMEKEELNAIQFLKSHACMHSAGSTNDKLHVTSINIIAFKLQKHCLE